MADETPSEQTEPRPKWVDLFGIDPTFPTPTEPDTRTEWVALVPISEGIEEIVYQGMSEMTAREVGAVVRRREVTAWIEVTS